MWVQSLSREDPLEEGMATHSSYLSWSIQWTEEPGELQSTGVTQSWTRMTQLSMHMRSQIMRLIYLQRANIVHSGAPVCRAGVFPGGLTSLLSAHPVTLPQHFGASS